MDLKLEINAKAINDSSRVLEGSGIMITPPIDETFWLLRVPVSQKQAIVGFPKFGVIGVGFQLEEDWNTNLPSGTDAIEIFNHIKHNKGDGRIPDARCVEAIRLIQKAVRQMHMAETLEKLKQAPTESAQLALICRFLRRDNAYELAEVIGH